MSLQHRRLFLLLMLVFMLTRVDAQNSCGDFHATAQDTMILPGDTVMIQLSGMEEYEWIPNNMWGNFYTRPWQKVAPTVSTDYNVLGKFYESDSTMSVNGGFESGNTGFTSYYSYNATSAWNEGVYCINSVAHNVHANFCTTCYDHTYGTISGHYMIVNGTGTQNVSVWQQTININPNTKYRFSCYVMTVNNQTMPLNKVAHLQFFVNNQVGQEFYADTQPGHWDMAAFDWESGYNDHTATIKIVNLNTELDGNDFGLDDIWFSPMIDCPKTIHVEVLPPATANDDVQEICQEGSFSINPTFNDDIDPRLLSDNFGISISLVGQPAHGEALLGGSVITYTGATGYSGTDTVWYAIKTRNAFPDTAAIIVTINPAYTTILHDTVCEGQGYDKNGFFVSPAATQEVSLLHQTQQLTSIHGCDSIVELYLTIQPIYASIAPLTDIPFCDDNATDLVAHSSLPEFLWSTGETDSVIHVENAGLYTVTVSGYGCQKEAAFKIDYCEYPLRLPNAITPSNEDGLNDYFYIPEIMAGDWQTFEIAIYDRWGEQVYVSSNKGFHWDGRVRDKLPVNAVYTWIIHCTNAAGKPIVYRGELVVL
ncbi:MAG: gliding motility-associated C-terminal domain-containing protein [Bacteroidales bacterium]|nr:gliding motility-associated C-terminal domain-containing protein [Bacteroidales bacterium]